jgi:hypothetical protein
MKIGLIIMSIFFMTNCTKQPMEIYDFEAANIDKLTETGNHYVMQGYLVNNFRNNKESEQIIQSHMCKVLRMDYRQIDSYFINYYEYSDKVNNNEYRSRKKFCELAMIDAIIFSYVIRRGRVEKIKFNNGREILPLIDFKCDGIVSK